MLKTKFSNLFDGRNLNCCTLNTKCKFQSRPVLSSQNASVQSSSCLWTLVVTSLLLPLANRYFIYKFNVSTNKFSYVINYRREIGTNS